MQGYLPGHLRRIRIRLLHALQRVRTVSCRPTATASRQSQYTELDSGTFAPCKSCQQSEELVRYLMQDFEKDPIKIWESDIFGRSLHSIVREGIQGKVAMMPDNARYKLQETLARIVNEGSGGLIAIIL